MPNASGWIATHESGKVLHFSLEHGWIIEVVTERIAKRCLRDEVLELLAKLCELPEWDGVQSYRPKTPLEIADEIRSLKANP